jgi:hypothetical protein
MFGGALRLPILSAPAGQSATRCRLLSDSPVLVPFEATKEITITIQAPESGFWFTQSCPGVRKTNARLVARNRQLEREPP